MYRPMALFALSKHTYACICGVIYRHMLMVGEYYCPLTCLLLSCQKLRVQVCCLTLAGVSYFWIINGNKFKLIAMSRCHRHHDSPLKDYLWGALVRGLQGPDVCVFSPDSFRSDWPEWILRKFFPQFMFLEIVHLVLLETMLFPGAASYSHENHVVQHMLS